MLGDGAGVDYVVGGEEFDGRIVVGEVDLGACRTMQTSEDCLVAVDGLSGPGDDSLLYQGKGAGAVSSECQPRSRFPSKAPIRGR